MNCPRCKVPMTEGTVLVPGIHKSSDDLGGSVVTVCEGPATEGPVPCMKCPECGHSVVGGPDLRLTRKKAKQILAAEPGSEITGVVICCPDGRRAIVEMSAVRWMEKDDAWGMMHPKPDIPTSPLQLERHTDAVPCACGGYCDLVESTTDECETHGCGRDRPGHECCVASFVCRICGSRYAGHRSAPDID